MSRWTPYVLKKCTVWVIISKHGTIGPFFFEDDRSNTVIVIKEYYIPVLEQFKEELEDREDPGEEEQWFQRDDAPTHTANIIMT